MVLYRMLKYTKFRYMYTAIDIVSFPHLFERAWEQVYYRQGEFMLENLQYMVSTC